MNITDIIAKGVEAAVQSLYMQQVDPSTIAITPTRKEFSGDYTVMVFPFTKAARKKPEEIGKEIGDQLKVKVPQITDYNVVKGFLNLTIEDEYWLNHSQKMFKVDHFGQGAAKGEKVMVEFSSPNTNKPLHLGHIRNILLGWSCSKILEKAGYEVVRTQIVNDRGIAICKSMLAWQLFGNGETPDSSGIKGDFLVGKYYVLFETNFKAEYKAWKESPNGHAIYEEKKKGTQTKEEFYKKYKNTYFNEYSELGMAAKKMLLRWEDGDTETVGLWKQMNGWVYAGFAKTYEALGVKFDKLYYESDTYLLGKDIIEKGQKDKTFYQKEDGSVWIDLEAAKLDHKLVLRSDGTSVYITQDIGTAQVRYDDYGMNKMVYVVADEQNYHFQVLFETMKRLKAPFADGLHHLSYGMVDLPTGKMKSREGTVVDADLLIEETIAEARKGMQEREENLEGSEEGLEAVIRKIGMAALKFFILKVNPQKRMIFNPEESVDLQGQTGPFIQYSFVRINGVWNKAQQDSVDMGLATSYADLQPSEKDLIFQLQNYPDLIQQAATQYDPSLIANYCYGLAKSFNKFWHDVSIFNAGDDAAMAYRLRLSKLVGDTLQDGMGLLGIEMPDRM